MKISTACAMLAAACAASASAKGAERGKTGLEFSSYMANVKVTGPFAAVTSMIRLRNVGQRPVAGEASFPVPEGAAIDGMADDESGEVKYLDLRYSGRMEGGVLQMPFATIPVGGRRAMYLDSVAMLGHDAKRNARTLELPLPRTKLGECAASVSVDAAACADAPTLEGMNAAKFAERGDAWRTASSAVGVEPKGDLRISVPTPTNAVVALETDGSNTWFVIDAPSPAPLPWKPATSANAFRILWDASAKREGEHSRRAMDAVGILPRNTYYSLVVFRGKPEKEIFFSSREELIAALKKVKYEGEADLGALSEAVAPLADGSRITTLLFTGGGAKKSELDVAFGKHNPLALVSGAVPDLPALKTACRGRVLDLARATLEDVAVEILHPAQRLVGVRGDGVADLQGVGQPATGRVVLLGRLAQSEAVVCLDFGDERLSDLFTLREEDAKPGKVLSAVHRLGFANPFSR